ncbi:hemagglutinin repeat-containing protein [Stenotrophomonas maltophilia]|nr:hemagglutinin repeat-containing protein [Stenotrophomonas maltophilia]MDT3429341.1 hemagglutinin repeat-containing protein [Stenotrophomonas maltophilia]
MGSSKANSDSNTWQNTTLTGQNISLKAEGDTTLRGATPRPTASTSRPAAR